MRAVAAPGAEIEVASSAPSEERRKGVCRLLRLVGEITGQPPRTLTPRWLGLGPVFTRRPD
nr:hypothetical protein OH820_22975 [Streptomyces sp. NBC_00857]